MYVFIIVLMTLVALLLGVVVLIQSGKGGGLASNFSSSNQIMGVRRTTEVIEKITWGFGAGLFLLALMGSFSVPKAGKTVARDLKIKGKLENVTTTAPTPPPANQQQQQGQQQQQAPAGNQQQPAQQPK